MESYKPAEPIPEALADFGQRLQLARRHRALRQLDLAAKSGIARTTINYLENGKRPPSIESVIKLAVALEVEDSWLAFGVGESGLPEGEPEYVPPIPLNKGISPEVRAERRQINQTAHALSQRRGTSFVAEREAIKAQKAAEEREAKRQTDEAASRREAIDRYGFDPDAYQSNL